MSLRSLAPGSKLEAAVTAVIVLSASFGGAFALGLVGTPQVAAVENSFGGVTREETVVNTDLVVHNPYPVSVRLGDTRIDYTVRMNGVEMAAGSKTGVAIGPGNTTLGFTTEMRNDRIPPWWVSHVGGGEVTNVTVDANIQTGLLGNRTFEVEQQQRVETDIIGQFNSNETRPIDGPPNPIYSNPMLYVNETTADWGSVSANETPIDMRFAIYNPQLKPYTMTEVGYVITMNGVEVGEGTTDEPYILSPHATTVVETRPTIDNSRLDDWWVTHLQNDQATQLRIDFYAKVELPTGNTVRVPLNELTYEKTIETDIFGNEADASAAGNSSAAATPTTASGATPTPGGVLGGDATPTASPSSTDSDATPTGTDGGLLGSIGVTFIRAGLLPTAA